MTVHQRQRGPNGTSPAHGAPNRVAETMLFLGEAPYRDRGRRIPVSRSGNERSAGRAADILVADIGATNTRVAFVSEDGAVARKIVGSTPREGSDPLVIARKTASMIRAIASDDEIRASARIGISTAGPVDRLSGSMVHPPNIPFAEVPLADPLCREFGIPVHVVNDSRAAVLAEVRYGAGRGYADVVYLTFSTGIGGGAFIGGRLIEGSDGNAGEVGHFTVETRYGLCCGCGGTGHWEAYASGRNIPSFYRAWLDREGRQPGRPSADRCETIFAAARSGDSSVLRFLDVLGTINGRGISAVIAAYNPSVIVLDGPVVRHNAEFILPQMERSIDAHLRRPVIEISPLEGEAPLIGASLIGG